MGKNIEDFIPIGYENRVSREFLATLTGLNDREVRLSISESKEPIVNIGGGYFLPGDNERDQRYKREYVRREANRVKSLKEKLKKYGVNIV